MCDWGLSSPCLLARLSGSSDSWPRSKNRIVPFLNGFEWKLAIKLGTTRREDIGEEPSWVYKKPHIKSGTRVKTTYLSSRITVRNITTVMLGSWCFLFPHYQPETSNKYNVLRWNCYCIIWFMMTYWINTPVRTQVCPMIEMFSS